MPTTAESAIRRLVKLNAVGNLVILTRGAQPSVAAAPRLQLQSAFLPIREAERSAGVETQQEKERFAQGMQDFVHSLSNELEILKPLIMIFDARRTKEEPPRLLEVPLLLRPDAPSELVCQAEPDVPLAHFWRQLLQAPKTLRLPDADERRRYSMYTRHFDQIAAELTMIERCQDKKSTPPALRRVTARELAEAVELAAYTKLGTDDMARVTIDLDESLTFDGQYAEYWAFLLKTAFENAKKFSGPTVEFLEGVVRGDQDGGVYVRLTNTVDVDRLRTERGTGRRLATIFEIGKWLFGPDRYFSEVTPKDKVRESSSFRLIVAVKGAC